MAMLYPSLCSNEVCYKGTELYIAIINMKTGSYIHGKTCLQWPLKKKDKT